MALGEFFLPPVVVLDLPAAPAPPSLVTLSRGCRSNMVDWGNYKMQDCFQEKHVNRQNVIINEEHRKY